MKKMSISGSFSSKVLILSLVALVVVFASVALVAGDDNGGGDKSRPAGPWTPTSDIGQRHIDMASLGGGTAAGCRSCHKNPTGTYFTGPLTPPNISLFDHVDMGDNKACVECHGNNIFLSSMTGYTNFRCGDCHVVTSGKSGQEGGQGDDRQ
ncbi:MAG TPA: hypothetical protein DCP92_10275 [Nitrospiraceae bacterium]|jgi:hypothetical protein|nr:hypothetical protein [Nitrospiraceae bacterium]